MYIYDYAYYILIKYQRNTYINRIISIIYQGKIKDIFIYIYIIMRKIQKIDVYVGLSVLYIHKSKREVCKYIYSIQIYI